MLLSPGLLNQSCPTTALSMATLPAQAYHGTKVHLCYWIVSSQHLSLPRKTGCGIGGIVFCPARKSGSLRWHTKPQASEQRRPYCAIATMTISSPSSGSQAPRHVAQLHRQRWRCSSPYRR